MIAIFGAVVAGVWAMLSAFGEKESRASERLQEMRDGRRRDPNAPSGGLAELLTKASPSISGAFEPKTAQETSDLKMRLRMPIG